MLRCITEMDLWDQEAIDLVGPAFHRVQGPRGPVPLHRGRWVDGLPARTAERSALHRLRVGTQRRVRSRQRPGPGEAPERRLAERPHYFYHGDDSGFKAIPLQEEEPPLEGLLDDEARLAMTMTRKSRALTSQMERLIEAALMPGRYVTYDATFDFVGEVEAVERQIAKLVPIAPDCAVSLYETFLAGCYEKAEEIDDSSGSFGQFVGELHCCWIKARQATGADPDETADRLLAWMDDDPYGFCYHLEKDAAKVLDRAGLAAFEKLIRARFDAAAAEKPTPGGALLGRTRPRARQEEPARLDGGP